MPTHESAALTTATWEAAVRGRPALVTNAGPIWRELYLASVTPPGRDWAVGDCGRCGTRSANPPGQMADCLGGPNEDCQPVGSLQHVGSSQYIYTQPQVVHGMGRHSVEAW